MKQPPNGAYPILRARLSGKKPTDLILISTIGSLANEGNPVVVVDPAVDPRDFDWRWSRGLETLIVYEEKTKLTARVTTRCILDQKHNGLAQTFLWRADQQKGWVLMEGRDGESHLFRMTTSELREFRGLGCS